jgi:hypothetical protein
MNILNMKQTVSEEHWFKCSLKKNSLFLELKTLKDLKNIPQKWMLILEILTQNGSKKTRFIYIKPSWIYST